MIMTINDWLKSTTQKLAKHEIPTARLDCLVLLEDELSKDRAHILADPKYDLTTEQLNWLKDRIERRAKHEPLAYIRKKCEFYRRDFIVDNHVLVPRPETEPIIDFVKELSFSNTLRVADIGSGSGCIGITVKLEIPDTKVDLYDIDPSTFPIARRNAKLHDAKVTFNISDLLQNLADDYDVIIANLPYVPDGKPENIDVYFEPSHALFAGNDGLDLYRDFWKQVGDMKHKPHCILTEARPSHQHTVLTSLAKSAGYNLVATDNFIQKFELIK
jgi:release factor glutamine methyltransferase